MENIINTIRELSLKVKQYKKQNVLEAGTKRGLIEPLLEAMGWDFTNINEIEPEYPVSIDSEIKPVDYSIKINDKLTLFLEAKRVNVDLQIAINDGTIKALKEKVPWLIASNGDKIALLKISEKISESERIIFQFSLSDIVNNEDDLNNASQQLLLLRYENIVSGELEKYSDERIKNTRILNVLNKLLQSKDFQNLFQKKYKIDYSGDEPDKENLKQVINRINFGPKSKPLNLEHKPKVERSKHISKIQDRFFNYPNKSDKKNIKKNILDKKELWLKFIEKKKMSTQEFKDHYPFKKKATGGFSYFLQCNGLAINVGYDNVRKGAIFKINEDIVPKIIAILETESNH